MSACTSLCVYEHDSLCTCVHFCTCASTLCGAPVSFGSHEEPSPAPGSLWATAICPPWTLLEPGPGPGVELSRPLGPSHLRYPPSTPHAPLCDCGEGLSGRTTARTKAGRWDPAQPVPRTGQHRWDTPRPNSQHQNGGLSACDPGPRAAPPSALQ